MAESLDNIVLEHVHEIRSDQRTIREDIAEIRLRIGSMESHLAGFHTTVALHGGELEELKARVARIEERLELRES
jgi:hypothetical protein